MFSPIYSNNGGGESENINSEFESAYSNYWLTTKIKERVNVANNEFLVGYIDRNRERATEYNNIGVDLYRKKDIQGQAEHLKKIEGNGLHILAKITEKKLIEITRESRNIGFYSSGHGAFDYLYCIENEPLISVPLFENKMFLMHVTAMGNAKQPGVGFDFVKISVYDPENERRILTIPLMLANYQAFTLEESKKYNYKYYFPMTGYRTDNYPLLNLTDKTPFENNENEGRKHYSKIFVKDFDKNNKLDIIVWYREYASALRDDSSKKGFYLDKQYFEWYEEGIANEGLNQRALTVESGQQLLEENELAWKDGWPNKNMCKQSYNQLPYMTFIEDSEIDETMGQTLKYGY